MANQCEQLVRLLRAEGVEVELVRNAPYWPAWVGRVPVLRALFRLLPYLVRACGALPDAPRSCTCLANSGWAWHLFAAPALWIGRCGARR